ncbi:MAG: hypothetical protein NTY38_08310 [Acidobacteria bacterium]|nr:hypothetical protein [Acidobacteriota bacterium]
MATGLSRRGWLGGFGAGWLLRGQGDPDADLFICPMDTDVRSKLPGKCPKCGMALELGLKEPVEYRVAVEAAPRNFRAGAPVELRFRILEPVGGRAVRRFREVHEKLFHLFLLSEDLEFFLHEHPVLGGDGLFRLRTRLPKGGAYRLLCDFYPEAGTPQLIPKTLLVAGDRCGRAKLSRDMEPKKATNLEISLVADPAVPVAGKNTRLVFRLSPSEGLQPYLGAWGHLLAASEDSIDLIHTHPFLAGGGPEVQFDVIFPRAVPYRIWGQFQRAGEVNTAAFTLPVSGLE